jgi:5-methylcytosine-specific restriction endonuclease McrA
MKTLKPCEWTECSTLTHKRFCRQACRDKWQYNDPEWRAKKQVRNKKYNKENPEVLARAQKKWYDNGGKDVRQAWRENNRERWNELVREWRRANYDPAQNAVQGNKRRAMLKAGGTFTKDEWLSLCEAYGMVCIKPDCDNTDLTVDHVVPLSNGGTNTIDNIQPLCKSCNSSKGAKTIDYREG